MMDPAEKKLMDALIRVCDDLAWDRPAAADELFALTREIPGGEVEFSRLAESFGMMLVKLEARLMERDGLVEELKARMRELEQAREHLARRNDFLQRTVSETWSRPFLGKSPAVEKVVKTALDMAKRPINTMILGPTGSGKEVMAKMIFFNSPRREREFVAVNCSAIPDSLFESEMFGIEKGVATGVNQRKGLIEESSGGTLFLDEVGDMAPENQAKLLRALEEHEVMRVGGHKPIPVDLLVISATNADIREAVRVRRFREDLFYRLNVLELALPPLRERGDDILLLARDFLSRHSARLGRGRMTLSPAADDALMAYPWPGNVRELNNEMERAASLAPELTVRREDLSDRIRGREPSLAAAAISPAVASVPAFASAQAAVPAAVPASPASAEAPPLPSAWPSLAPEPLTGGPGKAILPDLPVSDGHKGYGSNVRHTDQTVLEAMASSGGNKSRAARLLGLTREGLRKRLKKLEASRVKLEEPAP
ncbi:MAG: sigma-54 dependent transcriptional regulator [Deltaproteobacteria bacterium]|jgi:transcriptional regulator with GAF, ATPase, and Fis domain|nr:sigma-54 dependent transcriptional regulator [Deltaproteobacteria bacterium]